MPDKIEAPHSFAGKLSIYTLALLLLTGIILSIFNIALLIFPNKYSSYIGIISLAVAVGLGNKIYSLILQKTIIFQAIGWTLFFWLLAIFIYVFNQANQ